MLKFCQKQPGYKIRYGYTEKYTVFIKISKNKGEKKL